jgi:hypothetical protein
MKKGMQRSVFLTNPASRGVSLSENALIHPCSSGAASLPRRFQKGFPPRPASVATHISVFFNPFFSSYCFLFTHYRSLKIPLLLFLLHGAGAVVVNDPTLALGGCSEQHFLDNFGECGGFGFHGAG